MKILFNAAITATLAATILGCSNNGSAQTSKETQQAATAETSQEAVQASSDYKTITLSDGASVTWIKDNAGDKLNPRDLFSDASDSLYNSLNLADGIPASVSTFLMKADGEYVLFDAGLGDFGGQMANHLKELNVNPDDIKLIYLTHLHVDHISGLVKKTETGFEKVFKNATVYVGQVEKDAWFNDIEKNDLQKAILGVYSDKLKLFAFGDILPHEVEAIDAIGHTPGHTVFRHKELLVIGDLMHGYALQINHPEINSNYDMDKAKSIESRKKILEYAKANKLTMAGMHLPTPGFAE
ncbi:MAG: MBL fold metallo-hydrolase [Fibrobacter sp.]|nr:MBL fold metallo-hydrolase [Fibrobacter sp.]